MVFNLQLQVQLLLLEVEQAAPGPDSSPADSVLGVAALGALWLRAVQGPGPRPAAAPLAASINARSINARLR